MAGVDRARGSGSQGSSAANAEAIKMECAALARRQGPPLMWRALRPDLNGPVDARGVAPDQNPTLSLSLSMNRGEKSVEKLGFA